MSEGHLKCAHTIRFFRTNKESSIWRQNDHVKFVGAFHLSRRVSDEKRACSISIRFFKIKDPFDGRSFLMCSDDPFFGTNKNRILKNGSCEQAFSYFAPLQSSLFFGNCSLELVREIPRSFERASPSNFRTQGSFIHINSGKIFERDFLSSDRVAKSATQKPWVF